MFTADSFLLLGFLDVTDMQVNLTSSRTVLTLLLSTRNCSTRWLSWLQVSELSSNCERSLLMT